MPALTLAVALGAAAPLLEMLISAAIGEGVSQLGDRASKAMRDASKALREENKARSERMVAIVVAAGQAVEPELKRLGVDADQGVLDLFQMPNFLAQVASALLLGGWPDLESLKPRFRGMFTSWPWEDLEQPLLVFYQNLESQLLLDKGPWEGILQGFRVEARLKKLDATSLRLTELAEQIVKTSERTASATERTADASESMLRRQEDQDRRQKDYLDAIERGYLAKVYEDCNRLSLAGDETQETERLPRLQRVYVDLDTTEWPTLDQVLDRLQVPMEARQQLENVLSPATRGEADRKWDRRLSEDLARNLATEAQRSDSTLALELKRAGIASNALLDAVQRISVLQAISSHPQLVLLGDPGSGKSTLTQRLAGALAAGDVERQASLRGTFAQRLFPVRIVLSRWAQHLPIDAQGTAKDLLDECARLICATVGDPAGQLLVEQFSKRLNADTPAVLLLLDGLDEVTDEKQRRLLVKAVHAFCEGHSKVPLIVTCRVLPYEFGKAYRLPLPKFTLARLSDEAIRTFVERWHGDLVETRMVQKEIAQNKQKELLQAIWDPNRPELYEMAGTPLLLTMMAIVHRRYGLPDSRAMLYEYCVDQLLYEWEKLKHDGTEQASLEALLGEAGLQRTNLNGMLNHLAYTVHGSQGGREAVDIPKEKLDNALRALYMSKHPDADIDEDATPWASRVRKLIDARSGLLNAREQGAIYRFAHRTFQEYLAGRELAAAVDITKFAEKIEDINWREVILLAMGYQIFKQELPNNALMVLRMLLPSTISSEAQRSQVLLLGEAYVHLLEPYRVRQSALQPALKETAEYILANMPRLLTLAMQSPPLDKQAQRNVKALARQRLEAGLLLADLDLDPPGLDDFVPVPGANFRIGRYPVTNRQFKRFVDEGGYEIDRPWWSQNAIADLRSWWGDDWQKGPRYWDDNRFNRSSQPVVGVSWYEAMAYCAWLTGKLRADGIIDDREEARLPTVEEWRQAAGSQRYPWGKTFDAAKANTAESGLEQTTPVHMYPGGKTTQAEIWDLAGNVWEWTGTDDGDQRNPFYHLCGGSWYNSAENVGSAARYRSVPGDGSAAASGCGWLSAPSLVASSGFWVLNSGF